MSGITWTAELDAKVVNGIARGLSRSQIAAELGDGFTRNMIIARHARIRGIVFPYDEARGRIAQSERQSRKRAYQNLLGEQIVEIDRRLSRGLRRNFVIALARRAGLRLDEIARHFELTKERINQICRAEGVPSMRVVP